MRKVSFLIAALIAVATPIEANATLQCVTYAREVTGLNLKGDAWRWWEAAEGVYKRGNTPKDDAVLVFKRQGSMVHGHVAVVRKTTSSRIVLVDHANWAPRRSAGRGKVAEAVPVMDVSPNNDWTQVRVWYEPSQQFGDNVYKTTGFVYHPGRAARVEQASLRVERQQPVEAPVEALAKAEAPAKVEAAKVVVPMPVAAPAPVPVAAPAPAPVAAPAPAAAVEAVDPAGKFDARAWAEQA